MIIPRRITASLHCLYWESTEELKAVIDEPLMAERSLEPVDGGGGSVEPMTGRVGKSILLCQLGHVFYPVALLQRPKAPKPLHPRYKKALYKFS